MLETRPRIADIQTTELLYYDPDHVQDCYTFCKKRDIDCLPVIGDETRFYRRNYDTQSFVAEEITAERRIDESTFIFRPDLLSRFQQHHVQFVQAQGELTGVVHFSDYNHGVVSRYLYSLIHAYEKELRTLAKLKGLHNSDLLTYFEHKVATEKPKNKKYYEDKIATYQEKQVNMIRLPEFQLFYLGELIGLLKFNAVITLSGKVVELRNMIMHAHELVSMEDANTDDFIYRFDSFERFFTRVEALLNDEKRVRNRIAFLLGSESIGAVV